MAYEGIPGGRPVGPVGTMPKLYEYRGVSVIFYSNEHDPVHVHGLHENKAAKAEIVREEDNGLSILIGPVSGQRMLDGQFLKDFADLVQAKAEAIVEKWEAYFVRHEQITPEVITRRIRVSD